MEATAKATLGIASVTAGFKAGHNFDTDCPTAGGILKGEVGPFRADILSPDKSSVKTKVKGFKPQFKDLFTRRRNFDSMLRNAS